MISCRDAQEFIPFGREYLDQHPGEVGLPPPRVGQVPPPDLDIGSKDWWVMRESPDGLTEEELYVSGSRVVWSRGQAESRRVVKCFTCDSPVTHAVFTTFHTQHDQPFHDVTPCSPLPQGNTSSKQPKGGSFASVCVVENDCLSVFTEAGQDYAVPLPFPVGRVWPGKWGVVMERQAGCGMTRVGQSSDHSLPTLYSLLHPLDDINPVIYRTGQSRPGQAQYLSDPGQQVVFCSIDPPILVLYSAAAGTHTVWRMRKATMEENNSVLQSVLESTSSGNTPISSLLTNPSTHLHHSSTTHSLSHHLHHSSAHTLSYHHHHHLFTPTAATPTSGHTPSPAPTATSRTRTSVYSTIPVTPKAHHTQTPRNHMATLSRTQSPSVIGTPRTPRLHSLSDTLADPEPLVPDLCLELLWTDHSLARATAAFLTQDGAGQSYLCLVLAQAGVVCCIRYDQPRSGCSGPVFGVGTNIPGRDAQGVPALNMMVVVEGSSSLSLYTGVVLVSRVNLCGLPPFNSSLFQDFSTLNISSRLYSPVTSGVTPLRRSSLLTSSRPPSAAEAKFDAVLSPVVGERATMDSSMAEDSAGLPLSWAIVGLRDPAGARLTLEHASGALYRITLPELASSHPVRQCLAALRAVLPQDAALHLTNRWYATRNAPGSGDFSPEGEWTLFSLTLLGAAGYDTDKLALSGPGDAPGDSTGPLGSSKKFRAAENGSDSDWDYLLSSPLHAAVGDGLSQVLGLQKVGVAPRPQAAVQGSVDTSAPLFSHLPVLLLALHLVYEDFKLNLLHWDFCLLLVPCLHQLAADLRLPQYLDLYWRDFPVICPTHGPPIQLSLEDSASLSYPSHLPKQPPSILGHLYNIMSGHDPGPFPSLPEVCTTTRSLVLLYCLAAYAPAHQLTPSHFLRIVGGTGLQPIELPWASEEEGGGVQERVVLLTARLGLTVRDVQLLAPGVALPLMNAQHLCRTWPPQNWPPDAYHLVQRPDLVAHREEANRNQDDGLSNSFSVRVPTQNEDDSIISGKPAVTGMWISTGAGVGTGTGVGAGTGAATGATTGTGPGPGPGAGTGTGTGTVTGTGTGAGSGTGLQEEDGMETLDGVLLGLRWPEDQRVVEVRRMLCSSRPATINVLQRPEVSDHDFLEEQERHLYALCVRTMALPVGRGMLTLCTAAPLPTEPLSVPRLNLTGRAPPRGTTIDLSNIEVPPNMDMWPHFHNGVAAGLKVAPDRGCVDSTWIVYNKPRGSLDSPTQHAGFLMALGLNGHLQDLATVSVHDYLARGHEMTCVGLLLGLAAGRRGSMDLQTTKLLSVHLECLLPPTSTELDVPHTVQVAAILALGLLYQDTAHRHMAEVLLREIGRPPGPEMENSSDRESYSLAAGLALGLVMFGRGGDAAGLADLQVASQLHHYIQGGRKKPLLPAHKDKYKSPSYQIKEGESVNIDVTAPGATLALGMIYFRTNNTAVACWMTPPATPYLLDQVRPDFLLLRTVALGLITWDSVLPTPEWVEAHVPLSVLTHIHRGGNQSTPGIDYESMHQAYYNTLAGACLVLGLKFAGSANNQAFTVLWKYTTMFTNFTKRSVAELAGRSTLETCLNTSLLALSLVMAGTGDLDVLRIIRHLRSRVGPANSTVGYGSHLVIHMALGFLFLGGGRFTLGTSNMAVAALLIACFPKFPTHSNDNRYHLQALRHLYILAAEPRLVMPVDVDTGRLCQVKVLVGFLGTKQYSGETYEVMAPVLLPELSKLACVTLEAATTRHRYWPITFTRGHTSWGVLARLLQSGAGVAVKLRDGRHPYTRTTRPHPAEPTHLPAPLLTTDPAARWTIKSCVLSEVSGCSAQLVRTLVGGSSSSSSSFSTNPVSSSSQASSSSAKLSSSSRTCSTSRDCGTECGDESEAAFTQALMTIIYEYLSIGMPQAIPNWLATLQGVKQVSGLSQRAGFLVWQAKLITRAAHFLHTLPRPHSPTPTGREGEGDQPRPLVSPEQALSLGKRLESLTDSWMEEVREQVLVYLKGGTERQFTLKCAFVLSLLDLPTPMAAIQGCSNPLSMLATLNKSRLPPSVISSLAKVLFIQSV